MQMSGTLGGQASRWGMSTLAAKGLWVVGPLAVVGVVVAFLVAGPFGRAPDG
jgi:hypothetical protein